jgi:hypothetical protein
MVSPTTPTTREFYDGEPGHRETFTEIVVPATQNPASPEPATAQRESVLDTGLGTADRNELTELQRVMQVARPWQVCYPPQHQPCPDNLGVGGHLIDPKHSAGVSGNGSSGPSHVVHSSEDLHKPDSSNGKAGIFTCPFMTIFNGTHHQNVGIGHIGSMVAETMRSEVRQAASQDPNLIQLADEEFARIVRV